MSHLRPETEREAIFQIYGIVSTIQNRIDEMCRRCETEDRRIRALELWQYKTTGILAVVGAIAGVSGGALVSWLIKG